MTSARLPNRWGIAAAAVLMQICLGAVYGWSVFKKPIMIACIHQDLGKYGPAINVITIVMVFSLILPLIARAPAREKSPVSASPMPANQ